MGSVGCLAKGDIFFWQNILKNRSKYRGDISEQSVVCTVLISAIIIEIFRKNIPISYINPYKKLASPLIPVCPRKSHMPQRNNVGNCCYKCSRLHFRRTVGGCSGVHNILDLKSKATKKTGTKANLWRKSFCPLHIRNVE